MARERRKFQRVAFEAKAVVVPDGGIAVIGQIRDISVSGAFIAGVSAQFGERVEVSVVVDSTSVILPGVVRWANSAGVGVQFALLGARETHLLTEIVRRRDAIGLATSS